MEIINSGEAGHSVIVLGQLFVLEAAHSKFAIKSYFEPSSSAIVDEKLQTCAPFNIESISSSISQNSLSRVETHSIGAIPHTELASRYLPSNGMILQDQRPDVP